MNCAALGLGERACPQYVAGMFGTDMGNASSAVSDTALGPPPSKKPVFFCLECRPAPFAQTGSLFFSSRCTHVFRVSAQTLAALQQRHCTKLALEHAVHML